MRKTIRRRSLPRLLAGVLAGLALLAGGLAGVTGSAAAAETLAAGPQHAGAHHAKTVKAAQTSCSASYSVSSDWGTGFTAAITVTNNGTSPITGWTVTYTYTGNQQLSQGWSGNWSQSGKTVTITNASPRCHWTPPRPASPAATTRAQNCRPSGGAGASR